MPHTRKHQTALSKYRKDFTSKMKEMDTKERVRAANEDNEKRRKMLNVLKRMNKDADKKIKKQKFKKDTGSIEA